jgi:murein endopeptidase
VAALKRVHQNNLARNLKIAGLAVLLSIGVVSKAQSPYPELLPAFPESSFLEDGGLTPEFCEKWNPEYAAQGFKCCGTKQFWSASGSESGSRRSGRRRRAAPFCAPSRNGWNKCDERTDGPGGQIEYENEIKSKIATHTLGEYEVLENLKSRVRRQIELKERPQAQCSVSNGFVADALPLMPTPYNRILLNSPDRCANYGTDFMTYLFEWLGNEIRLEYSEEEFANARLVVGDIGAPRGGCLAVSRGRRGHASHTNGQDIDIAFFNPRAMTDRQVNQVQRHRDEKKSLDVPDEVLPSRRFTTDFYVASNLWLLKKIYSSANQFSCVRMIILDQRHQNQLDRYARSVNDQDWPNIKKYLVHQRGHFNHFHMRVFPKSKGRNGLASCPTSREVKNGALDLEEDEELFDDSSDLTDSEDPSLWGAKDSESAIGDEEAEDGDSSKAPLVPQPTPAPVATSIPVQPTAASIVSAIKAAGRKTVSQISAINSAIKPSELFAKAQKEEKRDELNAKELAVAAVTPVAAGEKLLPDHKREPQVSKQFPVQGKRKGRLSRKKSSRNPGSVKNKSSKKKTH